MNLIVTKRKQKWLISPVRHSIKDVGRERQLTTLSDEYGYGNVSLNLIGETEYDLGFTHETDVYDFAHRLTDYSSNNLDCEVFVYIEKLDAVDSYLLVVIDDKRIVLDKFAGKVEVSDTLLEYCTESKNFSVVSFGFEGRSLNIEITELNEALTEKLSADSKYLFKPIGLALKEIESKKPFWLYFIITLIFFGGVYLFSNEETDEPVPIDPYASYFESLGKDTKQVKMRMQQDYNNLVAFLTFPGWNVKSVTHTNGQVSYSVFPDEDGDLRSLEKFAKKNNLHVMVGSGEIVLLDVALNTPFFAGLDEKNSDIYNITEVHHFLIDAFNIYLPNTTLSFVKDIPKGPTSKWSIRELHLNFVDLTKEDLIHIAGITHGLPVSFGGDSSDQNIGKYEVKNELISGVLKLSIYGEKQ